ncbi:MAG: hypothetical protein HY819_03220 [Acidobacteria bacterium]|nr:hypothetical protein [Acidobacteriota bacterium]
MTPNNNKTSKTSINYQDYLIESLKDPDEAIAYLNGGCKIISVNWQEAKKEVKENE